MILIIISIIICIITFIKTKGKAENNLSLSFIKGLRIANIAGIIIMIISFVFSVITTISYMMTIEEFKGVSPLTDTSSSWDIGGLSLSTVSIFAFIGDVIILGLLILWHTKNIKKLKILHAKILQNSVVYCRQCGFAIATGINYCTKCGTAVTNEMVQSFSDEVRI